MATPPGLYHLPFAAGLDESQETEQIDPAAGFPVLVNLRAERRGGFTKRLGFVAMTGAMYSGSARTTGNRLLMNGAQPCRIDGTYLDAFTASGNVWVNKGRVPEAAYRTLEAPAMGASFTVQDVAYCNGFTVVAYTAYVSGTEYSFAVVLDATSGTVVRGPEKIHANGTSVRLASYGNAYVCAVVYSTNAVGLYLDCQAVSSISSGWQSLGNIATDVSAPPFDLVSLTDRVALLYINTSAGVSQLTAKTFTIAGVQNTQTIDTNSGLPTVWTLSEGGDALWAAWDEGTDIKAIALSSTLSTVGTKATVIATFTGTANRVALAPRSSTQTAAVYLETTKGGTGDGTKMYARAIRVAAGAVSTTGSATLNGNLRVESRPFLYNGQVYCFMASHLADDAVLVDCTPDTSGTPGVTLYMRPVCAPVQRELYTAGGANMSRYFGRVAATTTGKYVHAFNVLRSAVATGCALVEYDFLSTNRWRAAQANGSTYLGGGVVSVFDGNRVFEANFHQVPNVSHISTGTAGAITFTLGGRSYVVVYEEVDADGNWHVSGTSAPFSSGNITAKRVKINIAPLSVTNRGDGSGASSLRAAVYGTADGGNPPYYRLGTVSNDPMVATYEYEDNAVDADITSSSLLYGTGSLPGTGGAGQDHRSPPGLTHLVAYNGMLVGAQGKQLWFSSQPIDGEGFWFNPIFTRELDEDVTALTIQDGSLVAFTRTGAYMVAGDPPSDNGAQGGLGQPRRLAIDVGCVDASSVVSTSAGVFFQSLRGIELLTRAGAVVWIGEKVQTTLAAYPVVTSAVLDDRNGLVRLTLAASRDSNGRASGGGRSLVYDLTLGTWISVDNIRGATTGEAAQDATLIYHQSYWRYAWLGSDGAPYFERKATDADCHWDGSSTFVTMSLETGWLKLSGLQGRQFLNRVLFMERKSTVHGLSMSLAYNYETTWRTARSWAYSEIDALLSAGWPITQLKHEPHDDAECQAVRVKITDTDPGTALGTGRGGVWLGLTFDVVPRPGTFEVPEDAS